MDLNLLDTHTGNQYSWSGRIRRIRKFYASRIRPAIFVRIRIRLWIRILPSISKPKLPYCATVLWLLNNLLSLKTDVNADAYANTCVADSDLAKFGPLDPGSKIGFFGSRIPNPYFWELSDNFLGKKFYTSLKIGPNFFLQHFTNKIEFNFVKFMATKQGMTTNFFHPSPLLLFLDPGSGMGKNLDPR